MCTFERLRLKLCSENLLVTRHFIKHCASNHACPLKNQRVSTVPKFYKFHSRVNQVIPFCTPNTKAITPIVVLRLDFPKGHNSQKKNNSETKIRVRYFSWESHDFKTWRL